MYWFFCTFQMVLGAIVAGVLALSVIYAVGVVATVLYELYDKKRRGKR